MYLLGSLGFLIPFAILIGAVVIVIRFIMALFGVRTKTQVVNLDGTVRVVEKERTISGNLFRSKEDALYQTYIFLGTAFLSLFCLTVNQSLGYPISWNGMQIVITIVVLALAYRLKVFLLLPVGIVGIFSSVYWLFYNATGASNVSDLAIVVALMITCVVIYGAGRWHDSNKLFKRYGMTYVLFGLIPIGIYLFAMSTETGIAQLDTLLQGHTTYSVFSVTAVLILLALVAAAVFLGGVMKKFISWYEVAGAAVITMFALILPLFPTPLVTYPGINEFGSLSGYYGTPVITSLGWEMFIIMNIMLFGYLIGWILVGYYRGTKWAINIGSGLFALFVIVRFIGFADSSLPQAFVLIIAGLLLMILGVGLSYGRKKLLDAVAHRSDAVTPQM